MIAACRTTAEELLIRVATEAGLRLDELTGLQRRDINLTDKGFTMPDAYIWQGGHGPRLPENNRSYGKVGAAKIIRRILTRVGLEKVTRPHGLRATGAQLLIEAGASMELVSQHLGHATMRTTEDYYVGTVKTSGLAQFGGAFG